MLNKLIYAIGSKKRNPSLMEMYTELKQSENWSLEQLHELQINKLKKLLDIAYNNTEYYRRLFNELGILPDSITSLDKLKTIPILEKKDIIGNLEAIRNPNCKNVFYSETSGSTGEPMVFYRNEEWDSAGRAAQMRGYSWYGVNPWDRNGYLWGHLYGSKFEFKTRTLDGLVNRFRLFSYDKDSVLRFASKLKNAVYLEGYSSMIYEVAKVINENGLNPINLKMVKGTSEKIYDWYQPEVVKAFGSKMVSEYGSGESTLIAYECPCGNMHVVMENVIVEEEDGEIIVTNLNSFSMPIIRYKLGDKIVINREKKCECGMQHEIIDEVVGRVGKNIYGKTGKYPSLTLYYVFKSFALKNKGKTVSYQGVQKEKGKIDILLDQRLSDDEMRSLAKECMYYFRDDVEVTIIENSLVRTHDGKFKDFVTTL